MRNLTRSAIQTTTLDAQHVEPFTTQTSLISLTAAAFDPERNVVFVTIECGTDILIWRTSQPSAATLSSPGFTFCGSYTSPARDRTLPPQIALSLRVLAESNRVALVTRTGDIVLWALSDEGDFESDAEVQGSVEPGILAASWSPDNAFLALATRDNLVLMTATFDVLQEAPLESSEFGEDAPINVGWGSKETQFHGSIGRAHLHHPPPSAPTHSQDHNAHADADDGLPRITWRGDGAFFAVSTRSPPPAAQRTIRVYSSAGRLQSTSERTLGLGACAAWRPNGGVIASTRSEARAGGKDVHDVVFFERNGLRHGEFGLRWPAGKGGSADVVMDLLWSPDSTVLAVWVAHAEESGGDTVQLWTTGNYHWYLKQEICAPGADRLTSVAWHPERPLELVMTTSSQLIVQTFTWETCAGASDTGCVGVVDGDRILLTPFRIQNVPPPMSSHQLSLSTDPASPFRRTPAHISLSPRYDVLAALWGTGRVAVWSLRTRAESAKGKPMDPLLLWTKDQASAGKVWRQVCVSVVDEEARILRLAVLASVEHGSDHVAVLQVRLPAADAASPIGEESWDIPLPGKNGRLVSDLDTATPFWQARDGDIHQVDLACNTTSPLCRLPAFCIWCVCTLVQNTRLFVGLAPGGRLYCTAAGVGADAPLLVAGDASSVAVAAGFVVFTTTAHEIQFAPVAALAARLRARAEAEADAGAQAAAGGRLEPALHDGVHGDAPSVVQVRGEWERRRVERGSRIVTVVPGTMAVVLQMPRGNLETVAPRPLVMGAVKRDLDAGCWGKAFMACRKHRIDPSVLVEHDQAAFMAGVSTFVAQVQDVDHINLFLTHVGRSKLPQDTIAAVCDALRHELEGQDLARYVHAVLTAHVVKTPPDYESGLALLLRLRETQPGLVDDAVRYIVFLVDADRLFDTALGMYDFSLVLLVAQHAQKDPREYLPFLRELRALPEYRQRFRIDDHLRRHAKALSHLRLAGSDCFEEALAYMEQHRLYEAALATWTEDAVQQHKAILGAYGTWLFERREYREAALAFTQACELRKAMVAHERAMEWQELFEHAAREKLDADAIVEIAYRVADELSSRKRPAEAARVLLDYADDVSQAVSALVQGNELSEARRVIALRAVPELLEEVLAPGALELCAQLAEELGEVRETLQKQAGRLVELRVRKAQEPDVFYGTEDTALHNVDVMTDVSMASAFTRYTAAPSAASVASKMSKRSSKTKRKMERKVGSGRKGTVDEEEYLLRAVTKLVARWGAVQASISKLLPHLARLDPAHRAGGRALQHGAAALEGELRAAVDAIWVRAGSSGADGLGTGSGPEPEPEPEPTTDADSWAGRMKEVERRQRVDVLERVPKPEVPAGEGLCLLWR